MHDDWFFIDASQWRHMIQPHGGRLVNRVVSGETRERLLSGACPKTILKLSTNQYQELINVATGRYSPLSGFMGQNDFSKVIKDMTLEDGTRWPLPVILDVDADAAGDISPSDIVRLNDPDGRLIGVIHVEEVYQVDKAETAVSIFGTDDISHPGVARYQNLDDFLVGGEISVFESHRYNKTDLHPVESRVLFQERGWDRVVGFQTRNAPHRAHEYVQKTALEHTDGLLIQPKLGEKKPGDYRDDVILATYRALLGEYYPSDCSVLSVFPSKMRYAGPREAVFDAIVRKNQGCTHFVVGRDHAGVGDFYDRYDAQRIFHQIGDIGITPMFFEFSFYCRTCDGMASKRTCPHGDEFRSYPSGSSIRRTLRNGDRPGESLMRPEVVDILMQRDDIFVTERMVNAK